MMFLPTRAFSQSIIDQLEEENRFDPEMPLLSTEKILHISNSKRIFLISNENNSFSAGDFISFVNKDSLVLRALVAKIEDKKAGIKIVKIYDLNLWKYLGPQSEVQIIRGDDSYFLNLAKRKKTQDDSEFAGLKIKDEDDLYSESKFDEDLKIDEDSSRPLKTDHIIGVQMGSISGVDSTGASNRYTQMNATWAYQLVDNFFVEGLYGQNVINDFPSGSLDTKIQNITMRFKYTISLPLFSFLLPYVGYQFLSASSPGAGEADSTGTVTQQQLDNEIELVNKLEKNTVVFGATVLKRLVPGWFLRVELGTDLLAAGFSLEF